jgi:Flp pilus assembly protein TadG
MDEMTRIKGVFQLRDQAGAAAIEFALVLPLLIILAFGIIEFSILFYDKAMITNASREGARVGIVDDSGYPDDSAIKTSVKDYVHNHLISLGQPSNDELTDDDIAITRPIEASGASLTVTVSYDYHFLVLPEFIATLTGPINLSATTVMRME